MQLALVFGTLVSAAIDGDDGVMRVATLQAVSNCPQGLDQDAVDRAKLANVAHMSKIIADNRRGPLDLIVTPELGIGHVENSRETQLLWAEPVPPPGITAAGLNCSASPGFCASAHLARTLNTTLVVGMVENHPCTAAHCPDDGRQLFNVALAFSPSGGLIAKYRKTHLVCRCTWALDPTRTSTAPHAPPALSPTHATHCYPLPNWHPARSRVWAVHAMQRLL